MTRFFYLYRRHMGALLLLAPIVIFLGLFFVWPLWSVLTEAVSDPVASKLLPRTAAIADIWEDDSQAPPPAMQAALLADLRSIDDPQVMGNLVRRLNSEQPGFRSLIRNTLAATPDDDKTLNLINLDVRWGELQYWLALRSVLPVLTDRYLLASVDLERDAKGDIRWQQDNQSANRIIFLRTFLLAATVTLFCVVIGLPYAMLAASSSGWRRNLLLAAVLLPLWTSLLVRTAAWYILLQDEGMVNGLLRLLGITDGSIQLLFNRTGVVIAMTHILLPFMVLPIYSVLKSIPNNLMIAAASLGAHPIRAFWRVLLPLSLSGVASGALLVFMAAIGYYITPALLGGAQDQMISSIIAFYAMDTANWGMASALGLVLLVITLILYSVYTRLISDRSRST